jgi:chromosomal replication initiator protein
MIADIQPPELESRIEVLRRRSDQEGLDVPPEVFERIASQISSKSELEVALICITAFAGVGRPA